MLRVGRIRPETGTTPSLARGQRLVHAAMVLVGWLVGASTHHAVDPDYLGRSAAEGSGSAASSDSPLNAW